MINTFNNHIEMQVAILPEIAKRIDEPYQIINDTDGFYSTKLLSEFKYYNYQYHNGVLKNPKANMRTDFILESLFQTMKYLHDSLMNRRTIQSVVLFINEVDFGFIHTNQFESYLNDERINWDISGSKIYEYHKGKPIYREMFNNPLIRLIKTYTGHNTKNYDLLCKDIIKSSRITPRKLFYGGIDIDAAFGKFDSYVLTDFPRYNMPSDEKVGLFVGIVTGTAKKKDSNFKFGSGDTTSLDLVELERFLNEYEKSINPELKDELAEVCDRLLDNPIRVKYGNWNTDLPLVRLAYKVNDKIWGEGWEQDETVHYWDNSAGTRNYTKSLKFKNLTCTTILDSQNDIAVSRNYNPEAEYGQYDMVNDDVEIYPVYESITDNIGMSADQSIERKLNEIDSRLIEAFKIKIPIRFIGNDPWLSPSDETDPGSVSTKIWKNMNDSKISFAGAQKQLATQFFHRIILMMKNYSHTNIQIGKFIPTVMLKSPDFSEWRKVFFSYFHLEYGVIFQSSEFHDLNSEVPAAYAIFMPGAQADVTKFEFHPIKRIYDKNQETYEYEIVEDEIIYQRNSDSLTSFREWATPKTYSFKSNKVKISGPEKPFLNKDGVFDGREFNPRLLGYIRYDKEHEIYILSAEDKSGHAITEINFERMLPYISTELLIKKHWYDLHTQMPMPKNTKNSFYKIICANSVLFSIFTGGLSKQSSFKIIKGLDASVKNEFFWIKKQDIVAYINDPDQNFKSTFEETEGDRFVATYLDKNRKYLLSSGKKLLSYINNKTLQSMNRRKNIGTSCLNTSFLIYYLPWDAGWYHVKSLLNKKEQDGYKVLYDLFVEEFRSILINL